jgi:hypothetical protein
MPAHCSLGQRIGAANDLDAWFLIAAAEYGLGSRDLDFFNEQIRFYEGRPARLGMGAP